MIWAFRAAKDSKIFGDFPTVHATLVFAYFFFGSASFCFCGSAADPFYNAQRDRR
jgi:hypothetical protein